MLDFPKMHDYEATRAAFRWVPPDDYNFAFDVIAKRAREADKTALVAVARDGERITRRSFADLDKASNRFARALLSLGAAKGDFALVMIPRIPAWYEVMLGCIKAGVVAMPGTTLLTPKDLAYRLDKSAAKLAIVGCGHAHKIDEIRGACPGLTHLISVGGERQGWTAYEDVTAGVSDSLTRDDVEATRGDDLMLAYFTSGTTALPKMVPLDHAYALAHALTGRYWMDLEENDLHWTLSDTGWAKAAWGMFPPWQMGAAIALYDAAPGFDADKHLRLIAKLGVTTFCAPPTVYRLFAQLDLGQYDLSSIRHSLGAGEPLNPEAMRAWKTATGTDIHDGYGQTETVNLVANFPAVPVRPGAMGKPVPGFEIALVDDDGTPVPTGEVGHIALRVSEPYPPGLFRGYYGDAAATKRYFRGDWYYTGDTARCDADGYFWFIGRSDDIITSSGYRISPFEVESAVLEHPAVAEVAVVAKPDSLRGEIVKAYVVLAKGHDPSDALAADIQNFTKATTAPFKYPREVAFRDALPKTISGKIRRVELRDEARAEVDRTAESEPTEAPPRSL